MVKSKVVKSGQLNPRGLKQPSGLCVDNRELHQSETLLLHCGIVGNVVLVSELWVRIQTNLINYLFWLWSSAEHSSGMTSSPEFIQFCCCSMCLCHKVNYINLCWPCSGRNKDYNADKITLVCLWPEWREAAMFLSFYHFLPSTT